MSMSHRAAVTLALSMLLLILLPVSPAAAHGLAGKRFFPSTLAVDDPFVSDELSLPSILHIKRPGSGDEPPTRETEISGELSKRITRFFGISLEGELAHLDPDDAPSKTGFGNLEIGLKWQAFTSEAHEALISLGLGWEVGGTGRKATGAESFDVVTPGVFFGKGFGDLPDSLWVLKPLALTGLTGVAIPTRSRTRTVTVQGDEVEEDIERHPHVLQWGFALEYSLPYLSSYVRDVGLPSFFRRLIPLVEVELQTPLDRGQAGRTTGTVNPGIIWTGRFFQVGIEAVLPINDRTGKNVGVRGMLHFFLDDLFPTSFGRPLFGK
jgi:hypothetical protein